MESNRKNLPPMSAGIERLDILSLAIEQLSIAQTCIVEKEGQSDTELIDSLEDRAKVAIQTASQYMSLAHRGKRLLIVEVGLPDLDLDEC